MSDEWTMAMVKAVARDIERTPPKAKKGSDGDESLKTEQLIKMLSESMGPKTFDTVLTIEIDMALKKRYAMVFCWMAALFSLLSYAVVILDAVLSWGISDLAITALIIETPIQFVGLLYIIARNLFPSSGNTEKKGG